MSADTLQPDLYDMVDKKRRVSSFSPSTCPSCVHAYENVNVDNILYMAGFNLFHCSAPSLETGTVFVNSCVVYMPYIYLFMYLMFM